MSMASQIMIGFIGLLVLALAGVGVVEVKRTIDAQSEAGAELQAAVTASLPDSSAPSAPEPTAQETASRLETAAPVSTSRNSSSTVTPKVTPVFDVEEVKETVENDSLNASASSSTEASVSGYTMAQVALHNNASSCWTVINGGVYDVTEWISQHPGGPAAILSLCGVNGSSAFNGQHSGDANPAAILASFKIGVLQ